MRKVVLSLNNRSFSAFASLSCKSCSNLFHSRHKHSKNLFSIKNIHHSLADVAKDVRSEFPKFYVPKEVEYGWYNWWETQGYFLPNTERPEVFSILLPPPNVTGTLHLGHALTATVQDVLARWHRMRGHCVLWIPGTDHAGIATQVVVEKKLWREGNRTRHDLGRDGFVREVWNWKREKGRHIVKQLRTMGASVDWSREIFTMDLDQAAAVREAFIRLYETKLIYRANALVNWSCSLQSAISDIEVDHVQISGPTHLQVPGYHDPVQFGILTDFAYKLCDQEGEVVVSTTRMETMLGDVALAVHPEDPRYQHLHQATVWHPFRRQRIPIVRDEFVDPTFGTGVVKITPAHDRVDFNVAKKHNLEPLPVISDEGNMTNACGSFTGMKRFDARRKITDELSKLGLLRGSAPHAMQVPLCSRSGDVIEFQLKPQWFIKCGEMAAKAVSAVENKDCIIEPVAFETNWFSWLQNIQDWCISRQLWWGHRIPMYHCSHSDGLSVWVAARSSGEAREKAIAELGVPEVNVEQDEDVLDTWFSSALLPFSSLGWPAQVDDLKKFYPMTLMETGHDILLFWVARMVMLGTQLTGQLPFKNILLHGIICDSLGRKMSKSLGNVVSPEEIIAGVSLEKLHSQLHKSFEAGLLTKTELEKSLDGQQKLFPDGIPECGTDALRFTLCSTNIKNHYISFDVTQCHTNRLFCNKVWQASRYILMALHRFPAVLHTIDFEPSKLDRWILSRLARMVTEVNTALELHQFHVATAAIKNFLYYEFCDVYLECTKPILNSPETVQAISTCKTLHRCLITSLHVLSPFMPFLTEELYQRLPKCDSIPASDSITVALYPSASEWQKWINKDAEIEFDIVYKVVSTIRGLLKTHLAFTKQAQVMIASHSRNERNICTDYLSVICTMTRCKHIVVCEHNPVEIEKFVSDTAGANTSVHLILKVADSSIQDQISKKENQLCKEIDKLRSITSANGYKTKAAPHIQKLHNDKLEALEKELQKLRKMQVSER